MPISWYYNFRNTQLYQNSPVHPISDYKGGSLSVTDKVRTNEVRKSLCLSCQADMGPAVLRPMVAAPSTCTWPFTEYMQVGASEICR